MLFGPSAVGAVSPSNDTTERSRDICIRFVGSAATRSTNASGTSMVLEPGTIHIAAVLLKRPTTMDSGICSAAAKVGKATSSCRHTDVSPIASLPTIALKPTRANTASSLELGGNSAASNSRVYVPGPSTGSVKTIRLGPAARPMDTTAPSFPRSASSTGSQGGSMVTSKCILPPLVWNSAARELPGAIMPVACWTSEFSPNRVIASESGATGKTVPG
mmetsp:Transcript_24198/g.55233  ORF Transcript_24198/g.55233 Transcript_24198/m.55233 type:complete len:218 (-) Transcript_24198:1724-2377(-)